MGLEKIGIVGAGVMGVGIATDLVLHGIDCFLIDLTEDLLKEAKEKIWNNIRFAPLINKSAPKLGKEEAMNRMRFDTDMAIISKCDFIIENVTEDGEIKKKVYEQLDSIVKPNACFAVNTSCLSITKVAGWTGRPEKIIGMHFMNPVFMKPAVEVIRGFHTSRETIETANQMLEMVDKTAIMVNDYPGFVSNRISHLYMNEAAYVLQDQVADPKDIDEIFKSCFGHAMGPLETADLIGLDTVVNSLNVLYESYQDSKFRCCPLLRKMVDAGLLGKKSGKGFYTYNRK